VTRATDPLPELTFEARLQLLLESSQASPTVIEFARREMRRLGVELDLDLDGNGAGMLVNHLVLALERARTGSAYSPPAEVSDLISAELEGRPAERAAAGELASRARDQLGAELPGSEVDFLAIHLAALLSEGGDARQA
jgi:hypothetical protein